MGRACESHQKQAESALVGLASSSHPALEAYPTYTLELSNVANLPIKLWPGMKIGQLCFFRLTSPAIAPYGYGAIGSRYQDQRGPTASRSWKNFYCAEI